MGSFCSVLTSVAILNYNGDFPEILSVLNPNNEVACPSTMSRRRALTSSANNNNNQDIVPPSRRELRKGKKKGKNGSKSKGKGKNKGVECVANTFELLCQIEAGAESITMCQNSVIFLPVLDIDFGGLTGFISLDGVEELTCEESPCFIARGIECDAFSGMDGPAGIVDSAQCPYFSLDPEVTVSISGFEYFDVCDNNDVIDELDNNGFNLAAWQLREDDAVMAPGTALFAFTGDAGVGVQDFEFPASTGKGGSKGMNGRSGRRHRRQ